MKEAPNIEIREFPDAALPQLWAWCEAFRNQVADDYSPKTINEFVDFELAREAARVIKFGVFRDDELGGCIWVEQLSDLVAEAHCIFKKEFFGHKTTIPALKLMAHMIFETGIQKIKMRTFADNYAIKSLLLNAGAHREGVFKNETKRNGELIDIAMFAFFASDLHEDNKKTHSDFDASNRANRRRSRAAKESPAINQG